jgi:hypothetical protein
MWDDDAFGSGIGEQEEKPPAFFFLMTAERWKSNPTLWWCLAGMRPFCFSLPLTEQLEKTWLHP